ncbi:MAG: hypothetical protein U1G08_22370, partial [Verrucomicrobiota bacterium]
FLRLRSGDGGGKDDGVTQLDGDGAVGLTGVTAGLNVQFLASNVNGYFLWHVRFCRPAPQGTSINRPN